MDRSGKNAEIDFLADCFTRAQVALCADYQGLTVSEITRLRRELHKVGCVGRVVKNTLARISARKVYQQANQEEVNKFIELMNGPCMVVVNFEDPVAPAKVLASFSKQSEKLKLKGAWLDGAFVDSKGVEQLSAMPGKKEMQAKLLALISAPATQLVRLMQTPGGQVARVVDGHRQNLEKKG